MRPFLFERGTWVLLVAGMVTLVTAARPARADDPLTDAPLESQIRELIEQLGSPQFATREKAQSRLQNLGLPAFDALLEARHHQDIEISQRVRYLLRGMPVSWSLETDPQPVASILRSYGQQGRDDRRNRMEMLAKLEESQGVEALCRIMRYEADVVLSKFAALKLLQHPMSEELPQRESVAQRVRAAVADSRRPAATWLKTYADTLAAPAATLDQWQRLVQDELSVLAKTPEETQRDVVRDLMRWHVDLLRSLHRDDDVLAAMTRIVDLIEPTAEELFDFVDWAMEREAWFVPEKLASRFPAEYWQFAPLVYRLAEARSKQGNAAGADEAAKLALRLNPDRLQAHIILGRYLQQERQLFDWAEQEFRYVIQASKDPTDKLRFQSHLALMLADLQREQDAAEVLKESLEVMKKAPGAFSPDFSESEIRSSYHFNLGLHFGRAGDRAQEQSHLKQAIELNPANIDIVIAMYRAADTNQTWRDEVQQLLQVTTQRIRGKMTELEQTLTTTEDAELRSLVQEEFAQKNNELAWLISNTEGDFQEAVRCSQESLRLLPESWAYQDTLGRCYYAVGDYENAIRYQKLAVAQAPYMQQMQRQLKMFEEALAKSKLQNK